MQSLRRLLAVFTLVAVGTLVAYAQSDAAPREKSRSHEQAEKKAEAKHAEVGDDAPEFTLKDADGKEHKLSDYKDKIVVLEWCCSECPWSNFKTGVGPRAKATAEKYKDKGVVWLAVDSTKNHNAEGNQKYAKENDISYPILMDTDGTVGRKYGARTTPHLFVINKGKIVYAGAFGEKPQGRDDKSSDSLRNYVAEAIDAVKAGKEVSMSSSTPWGCRVKYAEK